MQIKKFDSGATRDAAPKVDYEGHLSPLALEAYGEYMHEMRKMADGSLRDSDNWQKGIPLFSYQKSLIRHAFCAWRLWRGWSVQKELIGGVMQKPTLKIALCGILFNAMGLLHEIVKEEQGANHANAA